MAFASRDIRNPGFAGGDIYLFELLRRIASKGHRVSMVTSLYPGLPREEVIDGVCVIRVEAKTRLSRQLRNYLAYRQLFAGKAQVVIEEVEGPQGPFFLRLFVGQPIVLVWHQLGRRVFRGAYGPILGRILFLLDYVYAGLYPRNLAVVPSNKTERELAAISASQKRIVIYPALPDFKGLPLSFRDKGHDRRCEGLYFLTVNKIRKYKAIDHAIRAFGLVASEFADVKFVVGGVTDDVAYAKELRGLGEKLAPGRVIVFPDLSGSEKEDLIKGAYAFVLPSPVEGFSLATLESLAFGTPAIVSDGIPEEVVQDGYNGLKYRYGDIDRLAELYRFILKNPDVRERMSIAARRTASKFSWDLGSERLLDSLRLFVEESK